MIRRHAPRYTYPQEEWDAKKCARLVRHQARDGLGTPYPFKGYVGDIIRPSQDYNGGIIVGDEWYQGVIVPLPRLPAKYELVNVPRWGLRIIEKQLGTY